MKHADVGVLEQYAVPAPSVESDPSVVNTGEFYARQFICGSLQYLPCPGRIGIRILALDRMVIRPTLYWHND